jgi:DNA replication protein DnaC
VALARPLSTFSTAGPPISLDPHPDYCFTIAACSTWCREFLHDEAMDGHERILKRYLEPDLLIIDDMGMKQLPKRSGEYLFEVIMRRHDVRSTMMTSNRPLEEWGKLIGDVPSATAILDRFLHHSDVIQITGRSYRMGNSGKSSNSTKAPTGSATEEA